MVIAYSGLRREAIQLRYWSSDASRARTRREEYRSTQDAGFSSVPSLLSLPTSSDVNDRSDLDQRSLATPPLAPQASQSPRRVRSKRGRQLPTFESDGRTAHRGSPQDPRLRRRLFLRSKERFPHPIGRRRWCWSEIFRLVRRGGIDDEEGFGRGYYRGDSWCSSG